MCVPQNKPSPFLPPTHPTPGLFFFCLLANTHKGLSYLQTPDYATITLTETHPSRPMTLYKGSHSLFRALATEYQLNKAEFIQIYNLRPRTQVMLELIIEEVRWQTPHSAFLLVLCRRRFGVHVTDVGMVWCG